MAEVGVEIKMRTCSFGKKKRDDQSLSLQENIFIELPVLKLVSMIVM